MPSIYGPAEVRERWGVAEVKQVVDVLALVGDSVDNIPGVPGIGDKTAQKLLERFGTVEELIARAGDLRGKQRERIEQYGAQALLSKRLATIDVDVPVEVDLDGFARLDPDVDATMAIFDRLEFRLLKERLFGAAAAEASAPRGMATIDDTRKPAPTSSPNTSWNVRKKVKPGRSPPAACSSQTSTGGLK